MTPKQTAVLDALRARPDYWRTEPSDLVETTGMTQHGVQRVLYHLTDAGIVGYDDGGYYVKETA